jgi:hypothetical protein
MHGRVRLQLAFCVSVATCAAVVVVLVVQQQHQVAGGYSTLGCWLLMFLYGLAVV